MPRWLEYSGHVEVYRLICMIPRFGRLFAMVLHLVVSFGEFWVLRKILRRSMLTIDLSCCCSKWEVNKCKVDRIIQFFVSSMHRTRYISIDHFNRVKSKTIAIEFAVTHQNLAYQALPLTGYLFFFVCILLLWIISIFGICFFESHFISIKFSLMHKRCWHHSFALSAIRIQCVRRQQTLFICKRQGYTWSIFACTVF